MNLKNKKIFITGGSAGIGKAIIEELSRNGATAFAVMGRTAQKLNDLEKEFPSIQFLKIRGDVSQLQDVKDAASAVKAEWGELDILINSAGVVSADLLGDMGDEDIIKQVDVNLTGVILMTKHLLPLLKKSPEGALINISSGLGWIAMPFYSVYAATKSGVKHFSEAMRRELAQFSIHVMTVYPTSTDTDMMKSAKVEEDMDTPREVARAAVDGLLNKEIDVILGGEERKATIQANFNEPKKVDEKIKEHFESLQKRAKNHRSM